MFQLNKTSLRIIHGIFFVLMALSVLLYKERLFVDGAYYLFHSLNKGWFHIEADRITIALSQIFPLIGYYLKLPLKLLLIMSSLGHELFFYGLFLFVYYKLKDSAAAICLLLIHLVGQLWLFYIPFLEISYGLALGVVFYSILKSGRWKDDKWLILLILLEWFIIFSHPENLFVIPLFLILDYLNRGFIKKLHISILAVFAVGIAIKVLNVSSYDQEKLGNSLADSETTIDGMTYFWNVVTVYFKYYWDLLLLFVSSLILLLKNGKWKKTILFIALLFGLLFIINSIEDTSTFYWYSEVVNTPIVFTIVFFFCFEVWNHLSPKWKRLCSLLVLIIAINRIFWIWNYGEPLRLRMDQQDRIIDYAQTKEGSKFELSTQNMEHSYSNITWTNPIEALLFSAIDGKENTVSLATEYDLSYQNNLNKLNDSTFLFRRFNVEELSFLNPRFFELKAEKYTKLNGDNSNFNLSEVKDLISIYPIPLPNLIHLPKNDTLEFLVRIENKSNTVLPSSVKNQLFMSCHWHKDGAIYEWDGLRTPFEIDIKKEHQQHIRLTTPAEKGEFTLQLDLVQEGMAWLESNKKYKVVIEE